MCHSYPIDLIFLDAPSHLSGLSSVLYFVFCFLFFCFFHFQVIIMGFVCVTHFLLSCERGQVGVKYDLMLSLFLLSRNSAMRYGKNKIASCKPKKKNDRKKNFMKKNHKGHLWAENSAILIFPSLSLSLFLSR